MVVTLPLPAQVTQYFPEKMVSFLQWFAFWSFAGLLTVPWLFCIYQLVVNQIGRNKRIKWVLDEASAPKTVIVMPCYKEEPDVLVTAINSVVDCDYPPSCIHVFLSFDGDQEDELYLSTIEKLGVPLTLKTFPKSIDVTYRQARITVSRFPHGGKRHCQKSTFKLIDKIYTDYLKRHDNLFILFIDSDCILDKVCLQNFMYEMELKPGSKHNMLAMTGIITSTTEKHSLITLLQDMEYIHGQLFERSIESGCGSVTCLPGALTMLRFSAFRKMAKYYFADKAEQCDDLFDYGKCHLGEDRWLTHLFMVGAKKRYQIQLCTGAFCKTEAVQTYRSLLKQRRRWFLGFITNEVCMLTDIRLWIRFPLLCIVRFMNNTIRTTALLFFIMVISILTTSNKIKNLPIGFLAVSLGLNWALMIYFGAKLRRFKVWLYPIMFVINPFFNWVYMIYGIFTAGQRTWGGPRADAAAADATTTPQQAIEKAKATGDDLNIVPETFKPAAEAQHPEKAMGSLPVQPTERVEGRFAPPERLPGGWYVHHDDSGATLPNTTMRDPGVLRPPLLPRDSVDSLLSAASPTNSVYFPRTVESLMSEEDRKKYAFAQQAHRFSPSPYAMSDEDRRKFTVAQQAQRNPAYGVGTLSNFTRGRVSELVDEPDHKTSLADSDGSWDSGDDIPGAYPHQQSLPSHKYRRSGGKSDEIDVVEPNLRSSPSSGTITPTEMDLGNPKYSLSPHTHLSARPSTRGVRQERSPLREEPLTRVPTRVQIEEFEMERSKGQREPLMGRNTGLVSQTNWPGHPSGQEIGDLERGVVVEKGGKVKKKWGRLFKPRPPK